MKITVKKAAPDVFELTLDDTTVALEGDDLKELLLQITRVLIPAPQPEDARERARDFMRRIKNANDLGIQKLLRQVDPDDVLVLLKIAENNPAVRDKFHRNMSERSQKIFSEDLAYRFKDKVPASRAAAAIERLSAAVAGLEEEGALFYENVIRR